MKLGKSKTWFNPVEVRKMTKQHFIALHKDNLPDENLSDIYDQIKPPKQAKEKDPAKDNK